MHIVHWNSEEERQIENEPQWPSASSRPQCQRAGPGPWAAAPTGPWGASSYVSSLIFKWVRPGNIVEFESVPHSPKLLGQ